MRAYNELLPRALLNYSFTVVLMLTSEFCAEHGNPCIKLVQVLVRLGLVKGYLFIYLFLFFYMRGGSWPRGT